MPPLPGILSWAPYWDSMYHSSKMNLIPSIDISSYYALKTMGSTIYKIKHLIKNVTKRWRGVIADVALITFPSCAQSKGGIHSCETEIWGFFFGGDKIHLKGPIYLSFYHNKIKVLLIFLFQLGHFLTKSSHSQQILVTCFLKWQNWIILHKFLFNGIFTSDHSLTPDLAFILI